jgi:hypothetical protein
MGFITPSSRERTTAAENKRMIKKKIYSEPGFPHILNLISYDLRHMTKNTR